MSMSLPAIELATLVEDPFPHLIVEDALPAEIADNFLAEMPTLEVPARGRPLGSNVRLRRCSKRRARRLRPSASP